MEVNLLDLLEYIIQPVIDYLWGWFSKPDIGGILSFLTTIVFVYVILSSKCNSVFKGTQQRSISIKSPIKVVKKLASHARNKIKTASFTRGLLLVTLWFVGFITLWFTIRSIEINFMWFLFSARSPSIDDILATLSFVLTTGLCFRLVKTFEKEIESVDWISIAIPSIVIFILILLPSKATVIEKSILVFFSAVAIFILVWAEFKFKKSQKEEATKQT